MCSIKKIDCEDVLVCVQVEKARNEDHTADEFVYTFSIQNCSPCTIRNGTLYLRLGGFLCSEIHLVETSVGTVLLPGVDSENCGNGIDKSGEWSGQSDTGVASENNIVFDEMVIPPGNWEGWIRFVSVRENKHSARLPSTILFTFRYPCAQPCFVQKCLEADGDCLSFTSVSHHSKN